LLAVAAVSSLTEMARRQVVEQKLLPFIIQGLSHKENQIRLASCKCALSLSRSVKNIRTSLMDANIAEPLFKLLYDPDLNIQTTVSATLCNIILDFSPMKQVVIEKGAVSRLVELVHSQNQTLRLNGIWALKNMLFQSELLTKTTVIENLTWDKLLEYVSSNGRLISDPEFAIQEQSLCLLRNLACGGVSVFIVKAGC
jgi:hypothetical protein